MLELIRFLFTGRQASTIQMLSKRFINLMESGTLGLKTLLALALVIGQMFTVLTFDLGMKPRGQNLDLNRFDLRSEEHTSELQSQR